MAKYYNQITKYLFVSTFIVSLSCGFMAHAQPAASIPGATDFPEFTANEIATVEPTIMTTSSTDPCPEPKASLAETPNNLKLIQEDITRFTLCLQRAQLLDRLNDLSQQNMDGIQTILDEKISNRFGDTMPSDFLTNVPFPELSSTENQADIIKNRQDTAAQLPQALSEWFISDITGKNGQLEAKLIDESGNVIYTTAGQTLPNSEIKIKSITMADVKTTLNGQETILDWRDIKKGTAADVQ